MIGLYAAVAMACGGFMMPPEEVVDQAGEDILFAVDADSQTTEMHVRIQYQGSAEDFAWVLPVSGTPELSIGTDAVFEALGAARREFQLSREYGICSMDYGSTGFMGAPGGWTDDGVRIVDRNLVGPYETVVLLSLIHI